MKNFENFLGHRVYPNHEKFFLGRVETLIKSLDFDISNNYFKVRAIGGAERATLTSSSATHCRDAVNVPRVPKQQWLETNTLYYDDAEGPDRIGNYNVSTASR